MAANESWNPGIKRLYGFRISRINAAVRIRFTGAILMFEMIPNVIMLKNRKALWPEIGKLAMKRNINATTNANIAASFLLLNLSDRVCDRLSVFLKRIKNIRNTHP